MQFIRLSFITTMILSASFLWAQNFSIGHQQTAFIDASRANRSVGCEIYYPSDVAGDNVPLASGSFPIVAFGHGFVMPASVYDPYWEGLVPAGYIVILPTTEGSLFPSHSEFGKDLAFLIQSIQSSSNQTGSDFYGHASSTSAVMGHSMGGGASFLAMQQDANITALVALAPAETNPSAIAAAAGINRPALIFSGLNDCVAPPSDHQLPMYNGLSSSCKSYLGIQGGDHCQFASPNFNCTLGQSTCSPQATISSDEQQNLVLTHLLPWLNYYLKADCTQGDAFQVSVESSSVMEVMQNCSLSCGTTVISSRDQMVKLYPNPLGEALYWNVDTKWMGKVYQVVDVTGRCMITGVMGPDPLLLKTEKWSSGLYFLTIPGALTLKLTKE